MLQNWVTKTSSRKPKAVFSFADRSDLWPVAAEVSATGHHDSEGGLGGNGMIGGTLVATEMGWLPVQDLRTGDRIVTFDNGLVPLREVMISHLSTSASGLPRRFWPLNIPTKALANRQAMVLLPEQAILIESDEAEALYGDPFVLVDAGALDGHNGITRVAPNIETQIVSLRFSQDEIVYANGMVLMHCPRAADWAAPSAQATTAAFGRSGRYRCLPRSKGRQLIQSMHCSVTTAVAQVL